MTAQESNDNRACVCGSNETQRQCCSNELRCKGCGKLIEEAK